MSFKTAAALPNGFLPGEDDVIVGRGKVCYKHSGNRRLTKIVKSALDVYSAADATKKSKTELIRSIMDKIRERTPDGGFVKYDRESAQWFEVGNRIAREKVSQTFRDALNEQYKSSTISKTIRRRQNRIDRQTSEGSKDGSLASSTSAIDQNEIPAAKARLDALLRAATSGARQNHMEVLPPPTPASTPSVRTGMFSHLRPSGLLPGISMTSMTPSLSSLIAERSMAGRQVNYGQLLLNQDLGRLARFNHTLLNSYCTHQVSLG